MSGIYGDMLAFFPELFIQAPYFEKEPKIGAGYIDKSDGIEDVIIMTEKNMALVVEGNLQAVQNEVLNLKDKKYLWASEGTVLKNGTFVWVAEESKLFRITNKAEWEFYGGFVHFDMELVQGTKGTEKPVTIQVGEF